ncbi:regulatory LuxR family protein [Asanoa ferruginea]|uniref:Regulatory LuxR family protein n=1 Tax=Asanoa ferruginea TaxID=53367 RepID=A0A3D9ZQP3_9ACTN|nr:LuxR family transcriptional regulator [Asanoa ferruginea]REF95970.1 regulatory LuxR family protein [Asanoa ferruginea]GIF48169.1 helix-turn-helix transcriptional regulator [Asanoa ferruginea]
MHPRQVLYGRRAEREVLDQLLQELVAGQHVVLVLRGESGEGKTALLDYLGATAIGARIIRVTGVQSEMELAYAGLHQLCLSMLDQLDNLPAPQRDALAVAFGLAAGAPPDRFLVGLAALNLLSASAGSRPVICLIDDVQWLDHASVQALAFVARRLVADPIALVFTQVEPSDGQEFLGLPEMLVTGLNDRDARSLLTSAVPALLDERVQDRIIAEARGNPLALLELPDEITATELGGWLHLPRTRALESHTGRIERAYVRRLRALPARAQQFMFLAAVEPLGDPTVLWRAASALGLDETAAAPAEAAGLIRLGMRVGFCHPLARSAVYGAAGPVELRRVHRALADQQTDPDRRAWHRAAAASAPAEWLAEELERSAARARARGGAAAEAAFLRRSAELTPESARRGARAVAAAQAELAAGAPDTAEQLLSTAEMTELDDLQRARAERLRARAVFARSRGPDAPGMLLDAARRFTPMAVPVARETYLEALLAAIFAGDEHLPPGQSLRTVAEAARFAPAKPGSQDPVDLLLDGLTAQFTQGYGSAAPTLRQALEATRVRGDATLICLTASLVAMELWEGTAWRDLLECYVRAARETGTLSLLPMATDFLAGFHLQAGNFVTAAALIEEAADLNATAQAMLPPYTPVILAAWRGDQAGAAKLTEIAIKDASNRGEGGALVVADYAAAVLNNGLGHYGTALAAAQRTTRGDHMVTRSWGLAELVEAAARLEEWEVGDVALRELTERTQASGTPWALGTEALARAMLSRGPDVDDLYRTAIDRLRGCRMNAHLARAHLAYGEWLRRNNRRSHARDQLRRAHKLLTNIGADAFGERARNELEATGETVPHRTPDTLDLTPQEALIASLARDGQTNQEIGTALFISPRTVEWHLRNVFAKLAISSRRELRDAPLDAVAATTAAR